MALGLCSPLAFVSYPFKLRFAALKATPTNGRVPRWVPASAPKQTPPLSICLHPFINNVGAAKKISRSRINAQNL